MRRIIFLFGIILGIDATVNSKKHKTGYRILPQPGFGKSSCIIKGRSINIFDDDNIQSRQILISPDEDDYEDDSNADDDDDNDDDNYNNDEDNEENTPYKDNENQQFLQQYPVQFGQPYQPYTPYPPYPSYPAMYPTQYANGMRLAWPMLSHLPPPIGPLFDSGNKEKYKYKYKRKSGGRGKKNKKGTNINCIIIKRAGPRRIIKEVTEKPQPLKLFGWLPITRRRRNIAKNLKALKS